MISHLIASYRQRKAMRAPSSAGAALAKHGAQLRGQAIKATKDAKTAALRADIAAGRIANLGWKYG